MVIVIVLFVLRGASSSWCFVVVVLRRRGASSSWCFVVVLRRLGRRRLGCRWCRQLVRI